MKIQITLFSLLGVFCVSLYGSDLRSLEAEIEQAKVAIEGLAEKERVLMKIDIEKERLEALEAKVNLLTVEYDSTALKLTELEEDEMRKKVLEERKKAKGEKMAILETKSGKVFKDCTINKVSDVGISIRHSSGLSRVPSEELPEELHSRFRFEGEKALAQLREERKAMSEFARSTASNSTSSSNSNPSVDGDTSSPPEKRNSDPSDNEETTPKGWLKARIVGSKKGTKEVEFRVLANCPTRLKVWRTATGKSPYVSTFTIAEKESFVKTVWMRNDYQAELSTKTGKVLDKESSSRKTGLGNMSLD